MAVISFQAIFCKGAAARFMDKKKLDFDMKGNSYGSEL
jgi:hypothetical protein